MVGIDKDECISCTEAESLAIPVLALVVAIGIMVCAELGTNVAITNPISSVAAATAASVERGKMRCSVAQTRLLMRTLTSVIFPLVQLMQIIAFMGMLSIVWEEWIQAWLKSDQKRFLSHNHC